jgi:hypothetical protein
MRKLAFESLPIKQHKDTLPLVWVSDKAFKIYPNYKNKVAGCRMVNAP